MVHIMEYDRKVRLLESIDEIEEMNSKLLDFIDRLCGEYNVMIEPDLHCLLKLGVLAGDVTKQIWKCRKELMG